MQTNLQEANTPEEINPDDFIRGTILSVIFGLIATIPWIVVGYFGFFVSYLGYLIGLAAVKGFQKGAGTINKSAFPVILLIVIIAIPFSQLITILLVFIKENVQINLATLFWYLSLSGVISDLLISLIIGYIIAFLGAKSVLSNVKSIK